jgi:3-oxoacyl-[acyl-carrier protein] reductase
MENLMSLQDRTAIVTGAARGIGRAICLELARQGCNIAFNYSRSVQAAGQLVAELISMGRVAQAFQVNVYSLEAAEAMVREVKQKFGRVDYLINNAGITRDQLLLRMSENDWDEVIDTNLKGAFCFSKAAVRVMMKARFGSILNIASVSGLVGMPGQANYSASKAGLMGFTKALAKETAGRNVTVNALALGFVSTEMTQSLPQEYRETLLKAIPLGRFGMVEEVGKVAAFLLSDDARYITGQVIQVDGGLAI